jgi:hypothetical protein
MKNKWKPKFCNVGEPFPYLIVDNWYNKFEENAVWKELEFLTSRGRDNTLRAEETIVAHKEGKPLGRSYRFYLADIFNYNNRTASNIVRFLKKQQSKEFHDLLFKTFPHAINFVSTNGDSSLVSYYENNDVYDVHTDTFQFTCLVWFHKKPKKYKGGDFYFEQPNQKVESKHNRLVIFPSYYKHGVKKIKMNTKLPIGFGRYTITTFYFHVPVATTLEQK